MGFKCGIVGLPNVGKSTLFNALTSSSRAEAANFPFCTIEPNIGLVPVLDKRLDVLHELSKSKKKIYTSIKFVDIAGLVKGASKGEGLGNKFLSNIREVDAIIHLVRCFETEKIQHINKTVDPVSDMETIQTEILLADIDLLSKKMEKNKRKILKPEEIHLIETALKSLNNGKSAKANNFKEKIFYNQLGLLSSKPRILVCNVDENSLKEGNKLTKDFIQKYSGEKILLICADIEDQLKNFDEKEKEKFMMEIGLKKTGISKLVKTGYDLLGLETFFTSGFEESKAWTVKNNTTAPKAAAVIHTDFEKKFIRAEVATYENFIKFGGFEGCKENGKLSIEGKDYIVKDGDVLYFRVNS